MAPRNPHLAGMNLSARQRTFFARPPLASPRLAVRGLGIRDLLPPCTIDRPRGTGDHLILCAHDPLEIDPAGTLLPAGSVVRWPPGTRQFYRNRAGLRHSWIHCGGTLVEELLRRSGLPAAVPAAPGSAALCDRALDALRGELAGAQPDEDIAAAILTAWVLALARNHGREPSAPEPYAAARARIEAGVAQRLHLDGLAAQVGVSVQHFGRTFRTLFGETPIGYQLRLRMELAAWQLRDVERGVGEVAEAVGYADVYQFSRAFRRHYGCSPRRWRERLLAGEPPA